MTKTILITGATAGFGEAAARKFIAGGWNAIGTGRRGDRLKQLQKELGDAFLPLEIDMRDRDAVESLARLSPPWGDVDLLLNNAGLAPPTDPTTPASPRRPIRWPRPTGSGSRRSSTPTSRASSR
jgi:serine 3-dehydrogenase